MNYCKKCVQPDTRPGIKFDSQGVCLPCRYFETIDNIDWEERRKKLDKIVEKSGLRGSCNIQVRKSTKGVKLLEINPRFSSLVAARVACGFKDLEWSLRLALGMKTEQPSFPFKSLRFRRYFQEMIDFGGGYVAIDEWLPRHTPSPKK